MLNVVYKILAKVLAIRIEKILPNIINNTQIGFVKGRYILESLITCWEAMNWAKASGQDCAMLLIDYEKSYDRIEWGFIMMMLEALGFPTHYCRMVSILLFGGPRLQWRLMELDLSSSTLQDLSDKDVH